MKVLIDAQFKLCEQPARLHQKETGTCQTICVVKHGQFRLCCTTLHGKSAMQAAALK